jgi:hypothetical protein
MEVFRNAQFVVDVDSVRRIVRLNRTPNPIDSIEAMEQGAQEFSKVLKHLPRATYGLLIDLREGGMRNDEAFESAMRKVVGPLREGWRIQASLVRTAIGSMQIKRQAREQGEEAKVFLDEAEALQFVSAPQESAR